MLNQNSYKIPGGGFCATEDLAKFAIAVQTGALVIKATLEKMFTRQKTRSGQDVPFRLGRVIEVRKCGIWAWSRG